VSPKQYLTRERIEKIPLETHCRSIVNTVPSLEKAHRDCSNIIVEGCTTTLKEVARATRSTTQKTN
jgi:hypothetical protein